MDKLTCNHPFYSTWVGQRARCNNPSNKLYPHYGGRGITIHPEWNVICETRNHISPGFVAWLTYINETLGPRPSSSHSIDRINNDKGYVPGNLRWATKQEQADNRRKIIDYPLGESGYKWVYPVKNRRTGQVIGWEGRFRYQGKTRHLSGFPTPDQAYENVLEERKSLGLSVPND